MKDAVLTIRMPSRLRKRVEDLALREGRSLSQQAERLIEQGMGAEADRAGAARRRGPLSLSGLFPGGRVPTLADFRVVRGLISKSLEGEPTDDQPGR